MIYPSGGYGDPSGGFNGGHVDGSDYGKGLHRIADDLGLAPRQYLGRVVYTRGGRSWIDDHGDLAVGGLAELLAKRAAFYDAHGDEEIEA